MSLMIHLLLHFGDLNNGNFMLDSKLKYINSALRSLFYQVPENVTYGFAKTAPEWAYPKILSKIFKKNCGYSLNLLFPKTFNEKINFLKLYDRNPMKTLLTDKLEVLKFLENKISKKHIKEIYGIYNSFDEIDLDKLPESFYLKTNHGCKMQRFIESKKYFNDNRNELKEQFDKWLNTNFAYVSGFELQYKDIKPKIFAEEVIKHPNQMLPTDIEIFCFNGVPKLTLVRQIAEELSCGISLYSAEEGLLPYSFSDSSKFKTIKFVPLPRYYENMLEIAKKLSKGFNFVRIDFLYNLSNFYFAEMSFSPFSGFAPMPDKELDKMLTKWFKL